MVRIEEMTMAMAIAALQHNSHGLIALEANSEDLGVIIQWLCL